MLWCLECGKVPGPEHPTPPTCSDHHWIVLDTAGALYTAAAAAFKSGNTEAIARLDALDLPCLHPGYCAHDRCIICGEPKGVMV